MPKPNPRLALLKTEFDGHRAGLDRIDAATADEGRDRTAEEDAMYQAAISRMDVLEGEIDGALDRTKRYDAIADKTAEVVTPPETGRSAAFTRSREAIQFDPTKAGQPVRHGASVEEMGRFAYELGRAKLGRVKGTVTEEQYLETFDRWEVNPANEAGRVVPGDTVDELGRVVAHGVAADGTAPVTIEGDLIAFVDANRYAVNRSRRLPMPDNHAPTFKRPRKSQTTQVGQQVTEGDVLASRRLQNTGDTVTKRTEGGVLSLSEQEIDWTDPAMLGLSIEDLAQQYAIDTDMVLTAAIEAAVTEGTETTLSLTATLAQTVAAIAASAGVVYGTAKRMADVIYVAVDRWTFLAGLTDTTGRPAFPIAGAGPLNAAGINVDGVARFTGMNVLGLDVVVDPNFSANVFITAASSLVEFYEQNKGLLTINVPSTLEVQYAYRGYVAANVYSQALNGIEAS